MADAGHGPLIPLAHHIPSSVLDLNSRYALTEARALDRHCFVPLEGQLAAPLARSARTMAAGYEIKSLILACIDPQTYVPGVDAGEMQAERWVLTHHGEQGSFIESVLELTAPLQREGVALDAEGLLGLARAKTYLAAGVVALRKQGASRTSAVGLLVPWALHESAPVGGAARQEHATATATHLLRYMLQAQ
jgi:hypothetical protein